jgi:predicted DNA binding protein
MPRATLKLKSNESLVALSDAHPEAGFSVLGAWPVDERLRVLVETSAVDPGALEETLAAISGITDVAIRHSDSESVRFEVSTPLPEPHGAMTESGVVPSFPLRLEGGWFVGDLTASREQLAAFRDELEAADIEYELTRLSTSNQSRRRLTERQREVVAEAVERGYYELPRNCTLTDLAAELDVDESVVSRILRRAESRIVPARYDEWDRQGRE